MKFRHEMKHEIDFSDMTVLSSRLGAIMRPDTNAKDGIYKIRSMYFDDVYDSALRDKINGVNYREKFRIRYYNDDTSFIRLEKKRKINGLCNKTSAPLTKEQAQKIADGDFLWMLESPHALVKELYFKMQAGLRPKTIVDYTRRAFVFDAGNVRVTLDYDIRTGMRCADFLNPDCVTVPILQNPIILEVKWDEFLPDIIRSAVSLDSRRASAFSKYAACRSYD